MYLLEQRWRHKAAPLDVTRYSTQTFLRNFSIARTNVVLRQQPFNQVVLSSTLSRRIPCLDIHGYKHLPVLCDCLHLSYFLFWTLASQSRMNELFAS